MSSISTYPHVVLDGQGTPHLGRTRYKVRHLAAEHYHYGWSAEELLRQHPDLRPEEVYAALTFFYDHFDELVAEIQAVEERASARPSQSVSREELLRRKAGAS